MNLTKVSVFLFFDDNRDNMDQYEIARPSKRILTKANTITSSLPSGTVCDAETGCESTEADGAPTAKTDDDDDGDGEPPRPRTRIAAWRVASPLPAQSLRTATTRVSTNSHISPAPGQSLWRIGTVLQQYPISRSAWYQGIKDGQYPKPVRIGARAVAWRSFEILALIESLKTV